MTCKAKPEYTKCGFICSVDKYGFMQMLKNTQTHTKTCKLL